MGIISRVLDYARPQADGRFRVQERLVDHLGRRWFHTYRAASEAAAVATMNARDMTPQLKDVERKAVVDFVRDGGGTPDDFPNVDLTAGEKERAAIRHFSIRTYNEDPDFFDGVAPWISRLDAARIATVVGVSSERATTIKDRATAIDNPTGLSAKVSADAALVDKQIEAE